MDEKLQTTIEVDLKLNKSSTDEVKRETEQAKKSIQNSFNNGWSVDELREELKNLENEREKAVQRLEQYKNFFGADDAMTGSVEGTVQRINQEIEYTKACIAEITGETANAAATAETKTISIGERIKGIVGKIKTATATLKGGGVTVKDLGIDSGKISKAFSSTSFNAKRMLGSLVGAVSAYAAIRKAMSAYLSQNQELQQKLNACWYALGSLFAPVLEYIVNLFVKIVSYVDALLKTLGFAGIDMKNFAKSAGSAAKQMKQLAGFDEINNLSSDSGGSGGSGATNPFEGVSVSPEFQNFLGAIKDSIVEIELFLSGAALGLGAILAFSGINIPLGIALMAAGAAGAVTTIKENWDYITEKMNSPLDAIGWIVVGALTAIGAVLLFSGASIPLGLGLLIGGVAGLAAKVATNWSGISDETKQQIQIITAVVSAGLLALGMILLLTGAGIPLGLGLIAAGAMGLASTLSMDWGWLGEKLKGVWDGIKNIAETAFGAVAGVISTVWDGIKTVAGEKWNSIKESVKTKWETWKDAASSKFNGVKTAISEKWNEIKTVASEKWNNIKEGLKGKWDTFSSAASSKFNSVKSAISTKWNETKTAASEKWNSIKDSLKNKWDTVATTASSKFNSVKSAINTKWNETNADSKTKWDTIKTNLGTKMDSISTASVNKFGTMKDSIIKKYGEIDNNTDGITKLTQDAVGGVEKALTPKPGTGVLKTVAQMVNDIQGYFNNANFHFSVTGTTYYSYDDVKPSKGGKNIPSEYTSAVGTNYVPNDQWRYIHQGEAIIPKKFNDQKFFGGTNDETNTLIREFMSLVQNKDNYVVIDEKSIGRASANYNRRQSRIMGGPIV